MAWVRSRTQAVMEERRDVEDFTSPLQLEVGFNVVEPHLQVVTGLSSKIVYCCGIEFGKATRVDSKLKIDRSVLFASRTVDVSGFFRRSTP